MRRLLRWLFGIDNVSTRPTRAERRIDDELSHLQHEVERAHDRIDHHADRLNSMRARITNVQRSLRDDEDDDVEDDGDPVMEEINRRRGVTNG